MDFWAMRVVQRLIPRYGFPLLRLTGTSWRESLPPCSEGGSCP